MNDEKVNKILRVKKESDDMIWKYMLTPHYREMGNDISEARGHCNDNISILSFCDTADKKVITMEHLGHYYRYLPFEGSWGENQYEKGLDFSKLEDLGYHLQKKYEVWFVFVSIDGRGYNNTVATKNPEEVRHYVCSNELVLFVFGL
jgi:hypothetical protein